MKFFETAATGDRVVYFHTTRGLAVRTKSLALRDVLDTLHPHLNYELVIIQEQDRAEAPWGEQRLHNVYVERLAPYHNVLDAHLPSYDRLFRQFPHVDSCGF